jgi:SDR family mycofactocin-dependent oxidoreductase
VDSLTRRAGAGVTQAFGRVALVTGAARGIGAATVRALCARGYRVVAVDRCAGPDVAASYPTPGQSPGMVVPVVVDVRDRDGLAAAAATAVETFGRLDVAVAAAAVIAGGQPLWETPDAQLRTLLDVDLVGVWNTAAVSVPLMLAGPAPTGCRFVAIASAAGRHGLFGLAAYNAAKHGVIGLVRGLAADLVGTGVTAVAVSPGSTRTDMLAATGRLYGLVDDEGLVDVEAFAESTLLRRLLEPDELAATIAFCCSQEAAALNGSVVSADGGFRP